MKQVTGGLGAGVPRTAAFVSHPAVAACGDRCTGLHQGTPAPGSPSGPRALATRHSVRMSVFAGRGLLRAQDPGLHPNTCLLPQILDNSGFFSCLLPLFCGRR